jgi:hypothetical protein
MGATAVRNWPTKGQSAMGPVRKAKSALDSLFLIGAKEWLAPCRLVIPLQLKSFEKKSLLIFCMELGSTRAGNFMCRRTWRSFSELGLELELIQTHMTQKPLLWAEVGVHAVRKVIVCWGGVGRRRRHVALACWAV